MFSVEGLVADRGSGFQTVQQGRYAYRIVRLTRDQLKASQIALGVDEGRDPCRRAYPGSVDRLRLGPLFRRRPFSAPGPRFRPPAPAQGPKIRTAP